MGILDSLKNLLGLGDNKVVDSLEKVATGEANVADEVKNVTSDLATEAFDNVVNFDDIDISKVVSLLESAGIVSRLPEDIQSKITDGTISKEDVQAIFADHKSEIMEFVVSNKDKIGL
ncbi:MAG: hypothetical protein QG614_442 [Patescibacteria group bacterium]|nr:hypothetical protein [Patescibacteria group bacterium]